MRLTQAITFSLLFGTTSVFAQWIDRQGNPLPQTPSMKSVGNFGVQIVLTPDEKAFRDTWNAATSAPKLRSTETLRRGEQISGMILFHGCQASRSGNCDAEVKFTLIDTTGKKIPAGSGRLWSLPPQRGRILLADTSLSLGFGNADPLGAYQIQAQVTDKVSGNALEVTASFRLQH